ncbi:MAG: tryptophan 7-halogenase [Myxococcales bacterium]|nr:tryptophan 7-halogenase [Myxococcales bacterium]
MRSDRVGARRQADVVICGGGLAGLTLARQLRLEVPAAAVLVLERTTRPLPDACHKVGESTIELGAHYLAHTLGLEAYLRREHILKNGLRFFGGDTAGTFGERPEIGPSEPPVIPAFQLDRGKLERDLRAMVEAEGVTLVEGAMVEAVALDEGSSGSAAPGAHTVTYRDAAGASHTVAARWVVDAMGRRRLLQKQLGLRRPASNPQSAAWFRVAERVVPADLVAPSVRAWHARDVGGSRWRSTSHLIGRGYWVWMIPLSTGFTSLGVVADAAAHPFASFNTPERARAFLRAHEPALAARLEDVAFADFRAMPDYSYLSERVLSAQRWASVGEAGFFVDPLYSLGGDFLGLGNTFVAALVADDLSGHLDPAKVDELNAFLYETSRDALRTTSGNSAIFAHARIFAAKLWWDFFHYWSFFAAYFFQQLWKLDLREHHAVRAIGHRYDALNVVAQRVLETWAELSPERLDGRRAFMPLPMFPSVLADQHLALTEPRTPEQTLAKMAGDVQTAEALVRELVVLALRDLGPALARRFGEVARLDTLGFVPSDPRVVADDLPRRARVEALPPIARDMERALGRTSSSVATSALLAAALDGARAASSADSAA